MAFSLDPEVGAGLAELFAAAGDAQPPVVGDVASRRRNVEGLQTMVHGLLPMPADVTIQDFSTTTADGATRGPAIAKQILIYPMLDDRNTTPDPELVPFATWTYDDNATGWGALLGDGAGGADVSPYAAAARLQDPTGLPPAYIEVGELDIFRDEDLAYAQRLLAGGISTELHLHPQVPHAWEALVPMAEASRRAAVHRHRVISRL